MWGRRWCGDRRHQRDHDVKGADDDPNHGKTGVTMFRGSRDSGRPGA